MNINASMVKELRERTGSGMMECKKALQEALSKLPENGTEQQLIEVAIEDMRKSGQAKAAKKAGRIAAEGVIVIAMHELSKTAMILEVNCETDFVARDENFKQFAEKVANIALNEKAHDCDALMAFQYGDSGHTIEEARAALVAKIGENINIRRLALIEASQDACLGTYIHSGRIGVVVAVKGLKSGQEDIAKDLAMHIAASNPEVVKAEDYPADKLAKEREIHEASIKESGKPANIIEKIVNGKLEKFLEQVSLYGQPFIKDPDIRVADMLRKENAEVLEFKRFEVGEGIEKETMDFAQEVMSQVRGE